MLSRLRFLPQDLLARLPAALPGLCALCGSNAAGSLCGGCHARHFGNGQPRCRQCAALLPGSAREDTVCGECLKKPPAFDASIVAVDYAPPVDQLVLALKFGHRLALAPLLARLLHDAILQAGGSALPEVLTAVPLGTRRLRERGFNQALEIAKPLSRVLGVPLDASVAARVRETQAQSLLPPDERHRNVRHAFVVPGNAAERLGGKHVGVVDDVITTGETLNELAACLKRFGAARVSNFVFARTSHK